MHPKTSKAGSREPKRKSKQTEQAGQTRKTSQGNVVRTVKKRDGNNPVKIY